MNKCKCAVLKSVINTVALPTVESVFASNRIASKFDRTKKRTMIDRFKASVTQKQYWIFKYPVSVYHHDGGIPPSLSVGIAIPQDNLFVRA